VRRILDDAGLREAKIMATGDLNEYKIHELLAARAPIDVFGVGTDLATSADAPSLGVVYKLVEIESGGVRRYPSKLSPGKHTLPGAKQIFRFPDHDVVGLAQECVAGGEALARPVIVRGELVEPLPALAESRAYAAASLARLPAGLLSVFEAKESWPVRLSPELAALDQHVSRPPYEHGLF
jgi:nicotinate phosphoribosyltransferase